MRILISLLPWQLVTVFFIIAILMCTSYYLIIVYICISLRPSAADHLPYVYGRIAQICSRLAFQPVSRLWKFESLQTSSPSELPLLFGSKWVQYN